jgi:F-type H+-transporting ATPase subunit b
MKIKYFLLILAPALLLASGGGTGGETDIFPRTVNFIIFAAILYYLAAKPIKEFLSGRKDEIAGKLDSIQVKLRESHGKKDLALQKVEEAKVTARVLVETAKKEAILLAERISAEADAEIENLEKVFQDKIIIERRKITRTVVGELLDDMFKDGSVSLDQDEIVKIVSKKVA